MRKVEVTTYNPEWTSCFEKEANQIRAIYGPLLVAIHHIGSTSVPGLTAKPVIDLLPVVTDIQQVDTYNPQMAHLGYECKGENGLTGRRYFQKGGDNRTHHVHIFQEGNPEIDRHLAFRNYLRAHPKIAAQYGQLKERLAEQFPFDMDSYIDGKSEWVQTIEQQALVWQNAQTNQTIE